MRLHLHSSRLDTCAIITATAVAGLGAAGVDMGESIPTEKIGIGADLLAGGFFIYHKIEHKLRRQR